MGEQHDNIQGGSPTCTPAGERTAGSLIDAQQFGRPHEAVNPFSDKPSMQWNPRRVLYAVFTCALTGGLAMLIWTKLRLVTGVPRTAYAEPEREAGAQKQTGDKPSEARERRDAQVLETGGF